MLRTVVAAAALAFLALTAAGCHDGYSTYHLGVAAGSNWDDEHCHGPAVAPYRPVYRPTYCPPPHHYRHWGRGY